MYPSATTSAKKTPNPNALHRRVRSDVMAPLQEERPGSQRYGEALAPEWRPRVGRGAALRCGRQPRRLPAGTRGAADGPPRLGRPRDRNDRVVSDYDGPG